MTKEEAKSKYNRVAEDKSQLQQFTQDVINGEIGGGGNSGGSIPVLDLRDLTFNFKGHSRVIIDWKAWSSQDPLPDYVWDMIDRIGAFIPHNEDGTLKFADVPTMFKVLCTSEAVPGAIFSYNVFVTYAEAYFKEEEFLDNTAIELVISNDPTEDSVDLCKFLFQSTIWYDKEEQVYDTDEVQVVLWDYYIGEEE